MFIVLAGALILLFYVILKEGSEASIISYSPYAEEGEEGEEPEVSIVEYIGNVLFGGNGAVTVKYKESSPYETIINNYAQEYEIDPNLIKAVIQAESSWNPDAVRHDPTTTSYGLMQVTPPVAIDYREPNADLLDPETNIAIGSWHLARLVNRYGPEIGVEMYNVGETGWKNGHRNSVYKTRVLNYYKEYSGG